MFFAQNNCTKCWGKTKKREGRLGEIMSLKQFLKKNSHENMAQIQPE